MTLRSALCAIKMLVRCSGGDMTLGDLTCRASAARRRKGGSGGPSGDMACPGTGVWVPTSGGQLGWYAPHVVGSKPVFSIFLSGSSSVIAPRRIPSARFPAGPGSWLPSCASPGLVWACRATLAPSTLGAHPPCVSCCWRAAIPPGQGAAEPLGRRRHPCWSVCPSPSCELLLLHRASQGRRSLRASHGGRRMR